MIESPVSRRALLVAAITVAAGGVAAGLSGCQAGPYAPLPVIEEALEPLTPLLIGQQELLDAYQQAIEAFPELTVALFDLHVQARAHTDAVTAAAPAAAAQVATLSGAPPSSSPTSSPPTPDPTSPAATDAGMALARLRQTIQVAAGAMRTAALRAEGDLAALLGSCAASAACHSSVLS